MDHEIKTRAKMEASLDAHAGIKQHALARTSYKVECFDIDGNLKWVEMFDNLVVNAGLDDILDKYFKGSTYTASFFVGIVDNAGWTAYAAADTMASHTGWAESSAYSEGTRPALTLGTVASQSVDNSASKAAYSINATKTIRGAFVTDSNTKGGATGLLYGEGDFAASRAVVSGDTLNVTVTMTSQDVP